jgi:hypothetical protein
LLERKRLDLGDGRVDPSLCLAADRLYVYSNNGTTVLLQPDKNCSELARNKLGQFSSSPFFAGDGMFIRTPKQLICISN